MGLIQNGYAAGMRPRLLVGGSRAFNALDGRSVLQQTALGQYYGVGVGLPPGGALSPAIKEGGMASRVQITPTISAPFFATDERTASADGTTSISAPFFASSQRTASAAGSVSMSVTMTGRGVMSATVNIGADPTPEAVAGELFATVLDDGYTYGEIIRLMAAALLGKVSGAGSNAPVFRSIGDTKDRITATTTTAGNRTSVTLDGD